MSLTTGRGPLSGKASGRFNKELPSGLTYVEPFTRRVTAVLDGRKVVDSEAALLVHVAGEPPRYAFPADAVGPEPPPGTEPEPEAPGFVRIPWESVDEWWEERERVHMHPRNPYHRVDCVPTDRRLVVRVAGEAIVDTTDTIGVYESSRDAQLYVRRALVREGVLAPSATSAYCPYKGTASYWDVTVAGRTVADAAWSYDDPVPACEPIRGHLCFDPRRVEVTEDLPADNHMHQHD